MNQKEIHYEFAFVYLLIAMLFSLNWSPPIIGFNGDFIGGALILLGLGGMMGAHIITGRLVVTDQPDDPGKEPERDLRHFDPEA